MATLVSRGSGTPTTNGATWATAANAVDGTPPANPATYATFTSSLNGAVGYIEITGYHTAFAAVPAGSTINSVTVNIRQLVNNAARFASVRFQPYDGSTAIGTIFTATIATAARNDSTTFPVTLAQLKSATFKIRVTATKSTATQSGVFSLDHADVTVDYTAPLPSITQAAYQFFNEGTESAAVAMAAQDTPITADIGNQEGAGALRIRLQSTTAINGAPTDDYQLQWEKNASGTWTSVTTAGTTVDAYDALNLTEGLPTTNRLTGGTGGFSGGTVSEDGLADNVQVLANAHTELLFSLVVRQTGVINGDTLRFRVLFNGATTGMTYTQTPTINIIGFPPQTWAGSTATMGIAGISGEFPATLIETLVDTFDATVDMGKWPASVPGVVWDASGQAKISCTNAYPALASDWIYSLKGSSIYAKVTPAIGATRETFLQLLMLGLPTEQFAIYVSGNSGNNFQCRKTTASAHTVVNSIPYNATNHAWWRISELANTVYFEYSADGLAWNVLGSAPVTWSITTLQVYFTSGYYGTETAANTFVDNVNAQEVVIPPQTWDGSIGTLGAAGVSGSFTPGGITWVGSTATVGAAGISGSFTPGPVTWGGAGLGPQERMLADTLPEQTIGSGTWTIGSQFTVTADGQITHIRYYNIATIRTHILSVWTASDQIKRATTTDAPVAVGWREVALPTPLAVSAGMMYLVTYTTGAGEFPYTTSTPTSLASHLTGLSAVYGAGEEVFPTINNGAGNHYHVDVVYQAGVAAADDVATIGAAGISGSFAVEIPPQTWVGSTATVGAAGVSGSFAAGAISWAGSTAMVGAAGISGAFVAGTATWVGSTATVGIAGESGTLIVTTAWPGSTAIIGVSGLTGVWTAGTAVWVGSIATVGAAGTSGTLVGGPTTWLGSIATTGVAGISGTFTAGGITWVGSTATAGVAGESGLLTPGITTWVGSTATAGVAGQSGAFSSVVTWVGSTATVGAAGVSGAMVGGATVWSGSIATVGVAGASGNFSTANSPQVWASAPATIGVAGFTGLFVPAPITWTGGSIATAGVKAISGAFIAGPITWTGSLATVGVAAESGLFTSGVLPWVGSLARIGVAGESASFTAGPVVWDGSIATIGTYGLTGGFSPGAVVWSGSLASVGIAGQPGVWAAGIYGLWNGQVVTAMMWGSQEASEYEMVSS